MGQPQAALGQRIKKIKKQEINTNRWLSIGDMLIRMSLGGYGVIPNVAEAA